MTLFKNFLQKVANKSILLSVVLFISALMPKLSMAEQDNNTASLIPYASEQSTQEHATEHFDIYGRECRYERECRMSYDQRCDRTTVCRPTPSGAMDCVNAPICYPVSREVCEYVRRCKN